MRCPIWSCRIYTSGKCTKFCCLCPFLLLQSLLMINCCQLQGSSQFCSESFLSKHLFCACLDGYTGGGSTALPACLADSQIPLCWQICLLSFSCFSSWPPTLPFVVSGRSCPSVLALWMHDVLKQMPPVFAASHQVSHLFCVLVERKPGPNLLPLCWLLTVELYLNRKTSTSLRIPSLSPCLGVSSQQLIGWLQWIWAPRDIPPLDSPATAWHGDIHRGNGGP